MTKYIFRFTFLLLFSFQIQAQSWINSNRISSTITFNQLSSIILDSGEILSYGYFKGTLSSSGGKLLSSFGNSDYYLIKFLQDGRVDWMRNFGSVFRDYNNGGLATDSENNIYIAGGFLGHLKYSSTDSIESTGSYDIFLIKLDEFGNIIWGKNAGGGLSAQYPTELGLDKSGNIILSGILIDSITFLGDTTLYSEHPQFDYFYSKFESENGNFLWVKQAKSLRTGFGRIEDMYLDTESYLFTGRFKDSIGFDNDTIVSINDNSDVHLIQTDTDGNISWIKKVFGKGEEYSYTIIKDDLDNIYISGYYGSDTIFFESSGSELLMIPGNAGNFDIFIAKYLPSGDLDWARTAGGISDEKPLYMEFFDDKIYMTGYFSDTLSWGGIRLSTNGPEDIDMFSVAIDKEGNFREANSYAGRNNSDDQGRGLFKSGDNLYTIMKSNTDLLVLGDSIYTSDGISYNMYIGIIGCRPISVDNVIVSDVVTCYGDSTGSLQILATGGFGSPWQYSIDNGLTYQPDITYFGDLPAGEYPVVVIDKEGCAHPGNIEVVGQPDSLVIELITSSDITNDADGSIVVAASGGSSPYTYTLQPNGTIQGFGTYTFGLDDAGLYVVEVNDGQNCGPVAIDTIEIISTVGIENITDLQIKIYPNPSSGMMTLEMPFEAMEATLEILSLTGQVVVSRQVYSLGGVIRETIDVSDLSKGMYMLRVDGRTLKSGIVVN